MKNFVIASLSLVLTTTFCFATTSPKSTCKVIRAKHAEASKKKNKVLKARYAVIYKKSCGKSAFTSRATPTTEPTSVQKCIRPAVKITFCQMIYNPVARIYADGSCKTFSNECFAKQDFSCIESKIVEGTCDANGYSSKD